MSRSVNITKRERRRKLKSGVVITHTRWVLNYREPQTARRRQLFFERARDAQIKRDEIITEIGSGTYFPSRNDVTVADAVKRWLANRAPDVKRGTQEGYEHYANYVIGPLLIGDQLQRTEYSKNGKVPTGARLVPLLGNIKLADLATSEIRAWHRTLSTEISAYAANRAKMYLAAALALAAEDINIRPPAMPSKLGRGRPKQKKLILTSDQVAALLQASRKDREKGIYVAFPFLAGTRPSEQLALLWEDVDFETNVIRIQRMQERNGAICDLTKTAAGTREVPMCSLLRTMLLEWRVACPRRDGELYRVFPGPGQQQPWPLPRTGGGKPLLYNNFRNRVWVPALRRLGLPPVTPHSARHSFISTLQAQGIEIGLVAKLAGHANPSVTLGHYTQAVRGGQDAIAALERGYTTAQGA